MTEWPHVSTGAFGIYYGVDKEMNETVILTLKRGRYFKDEGKDGQGVPGGYANLADHEQPRAASLREFAEEISDHEGKPVVPGIQESRLVLLDTGIDYKNGRPGTLYAGCAWTAYSCELNTDEIAKLKIFQARMDEDENYRRAVQQHSNEELDYIDLSTPEILIHKINSGEFQFTYDHEKDMVLKVAESLKSRDFSLKKGAMPSSLKK